MFEFRNCPAAVGDYSVGDFWSYYSVESRVSAPARPICLSYIFALSKPSSASCIRSSIDLFSGKYRKPGESPRIIVQAIKEACMLRPHMMRSTAIMQAQQRMDGPVAMMRSLLAPILGSQKVEFSLAIDLFLSASK